MGTYTSNFTGPQIDAAVAMMLNGGNDGNGNIDVLTLLVPSKERFMLEQADETMRNHNKTIFNIIKESTKPVIVFLKELNATKPFAQIAMRMRHLDSNGEGDYYFAFGYAVPYTSEDKYGLLAYSDDMYKLYEDGRVTMIDLLGKRKLGYFFDTHEYMYNNLPKNAGAYYNQSYTSSNNATVPSENIPFIDFYCPSTGDISDYLVSIKNLFGSKDFDKFIYNTKVGLNDNDFYIIENSRVVSFTIKGGWTHEALGPVDTDITFDVDYTTGKWPTIRMREPVVFGGWANIDTYELTFREEVVYAQ